MAFKLSPGSYPIYLKDSRLNTNPDFDYSEFTLLGSQIARMDAPINTFLFTFKESGVYVFTQNDALLVISVQEYCPMEWLSELSETALILAGVEL